MGHCSGAGWNLRVALKIPGVYLSQLIALLSCFLTCCERRTLESTHHTVLRRSILYISVGRFVYALSNCIAAHHITSHLTRRRLHLSVCAVVVGTCPVGELDV